MKLPIIIRDALSHRCGFIDMKSATSVGSGEEAYWYMYDGHAEIVAAYLKALGGDLCVYRYDSQDTWDRSRPLQINLKTTFEFIKALDEYKK